MTYQPTKNRNHRKTRCYGNRQLNELKHHFLYIAITKEKIYNELF